MVHTYYTYTMALCDEDCNITDPKWLGMMWETWFVCLLSPGQAGSTGIGWFSLGFFYLYSANSLHTMIHIHIHTHVYSYWYLYILYSIHIHFHAHIPQECPDSGAPLGACAVSQDRQKTLPPWSECGWSQPYLVFLSVLNTVSGFHRNVCLIQSPEIK